MVAKDSASAYEKVLRDLEDMDIGFLSDRELDNIFLLAEDIDYPNCKTKLYI